MLAFASSYGNGKLAITSRLTFPAGIKFTVFIKLRLGPMVKCIKIAFSNQKPICMVRFQKGFGITLQLEVWVVALSF